MTATVTSLRFFIASSPEAGVSPPDPRHEDGTRRRASRRCRYLLGCGVESAFPDCICLTHGDCLPVKIVLTANASWNLAHFRKPVIEGLCADGHDVVALSPGDDGAQALGRLGVRHRAIGIDSKGTSPLRDALLVRSYRRAFL